MEKIKQHIKKCKELYKQNEDWIKKLDYVFGKSVQEYDPKTFGEFLAEYKRLKGRHSINQYIENLNMFLKITHDIFITGDARQYEGAKTFWKSRDECFECFVGYMGSLVEAHRYFNSVNNIKVYT